MNRKPLVLCGVMIVGTILAGCSHLTRLIIVNYTDEEVDVYVNDAGLERPISPMSYSYARVYLGYKLSIEARGRRSGKSTRREYLKPEVMKAVTDYHPEFVVELK